MVNSPREWGHDAHAALSEAGVQQIPYVPDGGLDTLLRLCADDNLMRPVLLSSEQEGVGVAAGAWLGGERAALLMQSSGVGNCINALSLMRTCRFPLLMIVTMRGEWREFNPWQLPMGQGAEAYAKQVVISDFDEPGDDDVLRKVLGDLQAKGRSEDNTDVRRQMDSLLDQAKAELMQE